MRAKIAATSWVLFLVMILTSVSSPVVSARIIGGGGGGGCSPVATSITNVNAQVSSSNSGADNTVTVSFSETAPSINYLQWGLNTTYSGYASGSTSSSATSFTLAYMPPGATFYFEIGSVPDDICKYLGAVYTGSFTVPKMTTSQVMGYVLGSNGLPISGATILASYGLCGLGTVSVDSSGAYSISPMAYCLWGKVHITQDLTLWEAGASAYWSESWKPPGYQSAPTEWNWQTFYLSPNTVTSASQTNSDGGQNDVYSALAFVHSTNAGCQVNSGYSVTNTVYGYTGGNGGSISNTYTLSSQFPASGSTSDYGKNVGIGVPYGFSGTYTINPSGGVSLVSIPTSGITPQGITDYVFYTGNDPVASPPSIGGGNPEIISVPAGYTVQESFEASASTTLQFGVKVSVGVSVGTFVSFSISTDIDFGISGTQTTMYGTTCTVGSSSSTASQYFEIYSQGSSNYQEGVVYHIWQCAPAAGGGTPTSCTPIDQSG